MIGQTGLAAALPMTGSCVHRSLSRARGRGQAQWGQTFPLTRRRQTCRPAPPFSALTTRMPLPSPLPVRSCCGLTGQLSYKTLTAVNYTGTGGDILINTYLGGD